jgi:hypothetical protein
MRKNWIEEERKEEWHREGGTRHARTTRRRKVSIRREAHGRKIKGAKSNKVRGGENATTGRRGKGKENTEDRIEFVSRSSA